MSQNEFGEFFREQRIKSGYKSQRQLAAISNISNGTIARIEAGTQKPSIETIKTLSEFLNSTTYGELLDKLGYFDGLDDFKKEQMKESYNFRLEDTKLFRRLINKMAPDGKFSEEIRRDIQEEIGEYVDDDFCYTPENITQLMYDKEDVSDMWDFFAIFRDIAKKHRINLDEFTFINNEKGKEVPDILLQRLSDLFIKRGLITRYDQDNYFALHDLDPSSVSAPDVLFLIKVLEMETAVPILIDIDQEVTADSNKSSDLIDILSETNITYRNRNLSEEERKKILIMLAVLFPDHT